MENEKDLKKDYPDYLKKEDFNTSNFKFLLPYCFEYKEMLQRRDFVARSVEAHEKISEVKVNETIESIATKVKDVFREEKLFQSAEAVTVGYIYVGDSYSAKSNEIFDRNRNKESFDIKKTNKFQILKTIDAISVGDETLYAWWHPETERLAKFESRNEWAIKIGKHNSRKVENRIDDYKTPIPYRPIFGLVVFCKKSNPLEKALKMTLTNRAKKIGEVGDEWFFTSILEIEEILKFNKFIP